MNQYTIRQQLPLSAKKAFQYFSDEKTLDSLTPPWQKITILQKSSKRTQKGTTIDYRFVLHGFPLRWRSQIVEWHPFKSFSYVQEKGPYAYFKHDHIFTPNSKGCVMTDRVFYEVRGGWWGNKIAGAWVAGRIDQIFKHRKNHLKTLFPKQNKAV